MGNKNVEFALKKALEANARGEQVTFDIVICHGLGTRRNYPNEYEFTQLSRKRYADGELKGSVGYGVTLTEHELVCPHGMPCANY